MARIARIVTYVVDPNFRHNSLIGDVVRLIERHDNDIYIASIKSEEKDFEWNDDLIVNKTTATELDIAKFFRELPNEEDGDV